MWPKKTKVSEIEKYNAAVGKAMKNFQKAYQSGNGLDTAKKLGVLEHLGVADLTFFHGLTYQLLGDEKKAVDYFESIQPKSSEFQTAMLSCAVYYSNEGQYEKLHRILIDPNVVMSPAQKLRMRMQCLFKVDPSLLTEIADRYPLTQYENVDVENINKEPEHFYSMCLLLSNALIVVGEMINQAAQYHLSYDDIIDWENDANFNRYRLIYNHYSFVVSLSKCIPVLGKLNKDILLTDLILDQQSWDEKIRILTQTNYRKLLLQSIVNICNPVVHSTIPQYTIVERILEQVGRVDPSAIAQVVNQYYDVIEKAYHEGRGSAAQYLGYVRSEIIAYGEDAFNLKERLDATIGENAKSRTEASVIKTVRSISAKGLEAINSAELMFEKIDPRTCGVSDYSTLALQYFRVLEIELNEKLITPLLQIIDFAVLNQLNEDMFNLYNGRNKYAEQNYKALKTCIEYLEGLKSSKKTLEIGKIQTMLFLSTVNYMQNNKCANKLNWYIVQCLTPAGEQAFTGQKMQSVIDVKQRDRYRNPGAHTGYLPYSVAAEAREYVLTNLPVLESWFSKNAISK